MEINNAIFELDERLRRIGSKPCEIEIMDDNCAVWKITPLPINNEEDVNVWQNKVKEIISEIGQEFNLPQNWISEDPSMVNIEWKKLEFAIGKMHFELDADLNVITVYRLNREDLLKIYALMLDSSINDEDFTNALERNANLIDKIKELSSELGISCKDMLMTGEVQSLIMNIDKLRDFLNLIN